MTLLRAGARVTGYELRPEFAARAVRNVTGFLGESALERYQVEIRDVYEGIGEKGLDRVLLDLPEPWRAVKHAAGALRPGGIIRFLLPLVPQVMTLHESPRAEPGSRWPRRSRCCQRSWHVEGQSVRPDHRMVGHTGFLTAARLMAPVADERVRRRHRSASRLSQPWAGGGSASWHGSFRGSASAPGSTCAVRYMADVVKFFNLSGSLARIILAIVVLLAGAFLGQALGLMLGSALHSVLPLGGVRTLDRAVGAALGVVGVLVALWLLAPSLAAVPGTVSRLTTGSVIARWVSNETSRIGLRPPDTLQALRRLVGENGFPQVFNDSRPWPGGGVRRPQATRSGRPWRAPSQLRR